ncbi:hypothetical protein [Lacinutrix chionoecetis]
MKKQSILLITMLLALSLQAQLEKSNLGTLDVSTLPKEEVQLQTNTNFALVGEYLYYKLSVLSNNKLNAISKIAYVELIDAENNTIAKHILRIKNNTSSNRLFIPSQLNTGEYKLIAYTNWSINNIKNAFYYKDIYIVNAFSASTQNSTNSNEAVTLKKAETLNKNEFGDGKIAISTTKLKYGTREPVTIDIAANTNYKNGNYSLSVLKIDSIAVVNKNSNNYTSAQPSTTLFIPEMRGQLVTGKITNTKNALDINEKNIALSIPGKDPYFKIAQTNKTGQFYFNLDATINSTNATFQVIEKNNEDFKIKLVNTDRINFKELSFRNLEIDQNLKHSLEQRNIKNQIENAYYENKKDSLLLESKTQPFYNTKEKNYILDEYTRFKTVRETFIEVINEAGLRKEGDNYRIIVYDRYDEKKSQAIRNIDPLVVVDGMIVQNNNDLINYSPQKIESIAIVVGQYLYGSKLYQGIISVTTFNQDFKITLTGDYILETTLNLPKDETIFYQPEYLSKADNKRIPDYRRQLLWLPNVTLTNNTNSFKTYTSDNTGTYKITVEGYNLNGEYTINNWYFEVN